MQTSGRVHVNIIMYFTKFKEKLESTAQATLPARLQVRYLQRLEILKSLSTLFVYNKRCMNQEMTHYMPAYIKRGTMVKRWTGTYRHTGTKDSILRHIDFYKFNVFQRMHLQMNNIVALTYLIKMGKGDTNNKDFWTFFELFQANVGLLAVKRDLDYWTTYRTSIE